LLSQKSEHNREYDRVDQSRWNTGLSRHKETLGAWWNGQEHTWTECEEERGSDEKIRLGKNETHRFGNEGKRKEEDEGVKHDSGSAGKTVSERNFGTICSEKNTWTEC
jgi:hypothetical protein